MPNYRTHLYAEPYFFPHDLRIVATNRISRLEELTLKAREKETIAHKRKVKLVESRNRDFLPYGIRIHCSAEKLLEHRDDNVGVFQEQGKDGYLSMVHVLTTLAEQEGIIDFTIQLKGKEGFKVGLKTETGSTVFVDYDNKRREFGIALYDLVTEMTGPAAVSASYFDESRPSSGMFAWNRPDYKPYTNRIGIETEHGVPEYLRPKLREGIESALTKIADAYMRGNIEELDELEWFINVYMQADAREILEFDTEQLPSIRDNIPPHIKRMYKLTGEPIRRLYPTEEGIQKAHEIAGFRKTARVCLEGLYSLAVIINDASKEELEYRVKHKQVLNAA